jgi:hypothetical protein
MRYLTFIYGKKKCEHLTHLSQSQHGVAVAMSLFIPLDKLMDYCVRDLHVRCHNGCHNGPLFCVDLMRLQQG